MRTKPLSELRKQMTFEQRAKSEIRAQLAVPEEVQELVQKLAKVKGVYRVRAVAPRSIDSHWIEFELELQPEIELSDECWDKIQDLVIDCDWHLRDKTHEKWYFHAEVVEKFFKIRDEAKVVATSNIQPSEY